jgi:hypothetical protein
MTKIIMEEAEDWQDESTKNHVKNFPGAAWCTLVILATWQVEICRIMI